MATPTMLEYVQLAKELTGSTDIDVILAAATKLAGYLDEKPVAHPKPRDLISCGPLQFAEQTSLAHWQRGVLPYRAYEYQKEWFERAASYDRRVVKDQPQIELASRQMGATTVFSLFALWKALKRPNSKVLIVGSRFVNATEVLDRIRFAIESYDNPIEGPIKPVVNNKAMMAFENGSEIKAVVWAALTRSMTIDPREYDLVIFDCAAFYPYGVTDDLVRWIDAAVAHGKHVILASTPGREFKGMFHHYIADDRNTVHATKWYRHPDRDEEWKQQQIKNIGQDIFTWEYDLLPPVDQSPQKTV